MSWEWGRKGGPPPEVPAEHPAFAKAYRRGRRMSSADVRAWAEVTLTGISRAMSAYLRDGSETALREAEEAAAALHGILAAETTNLAVRPATG